MSIVMKRRKGRHKLIAVNFLANISLEGSRGANGINGYNESSDYSWQDEHHSHLSATVHNSQLLTNSLPYGVKLSPGNIVVSELNEIERGPLTDQSLNLKESDYTNLEADAVTFNHRNHHHPLDQKLKRSSDMLASSSSASTIAASVVATDHLAPSHSGSENFSPSSNYDDGKPSFHVSPVVQKLQQKNKPVATQPWQRNQQSSNPLLSTTPAFSLYMAPSWPRPVVTDQIVSYVSFLTRTGSNHSAFGPGGHSHANCDFASSSVSSTYSGAPANINILGAAPDSTRHQHVDSVAVLPTSHIDGSGPIFYSDPLTCYDPLLLDDPRLTVKTEKRVLKLSNYLASVLASRRRPDEQKRSVNTEFKLRFPLVQITLTKLRSIKCLLVNIVRKLSLDVWIASHAHVLLEKLVLSLYLNKSNRKACSSALLLISAKLNDVRRPDLVLLLQELEANFRVSKREIFHAELDVSVVLEFGLMPPIREVLPHYNRICKHV